MPKWIWRVSFTVVITKVKRQEESMSTIQFGSHVSFVGINGKMNNAPTKLQQRLRNIPLVFVLVLAVYFGILTRPMVF